MWGLIDHTGKKRHKQFGAKLLNNWMQSRVFGGWGGIGGGVLASSYPGSAIYESKDPRES